MTQIKRIFTDYSIRVNPCHPCNPCSTAASFHAKAPEIRNAIYLRFVQTINLRSSAFICGSFFAEVPSNDRCARLPPEHLPKFDVFVTFTMVPMLASCASLEQKYAGLQWW
jgi:hypothetical protein